MVFNLIFLHLLLKLNLVPSAVLEKNNPNFTGDLMCQKMRGLVKLPDVGVISSHRGGPSGQQCHYLAQ